jgi:TetR/AcrR family transcriptional regulator, repressor for uid operon
LPKLKPATQIARRAHILDAAEKCFARQGFHRTTMQDICRAARVSAGAVQLAEAPDLLAALGQLAQHYVVEQPAYKRVLVIEMGIESTRNPAIAAIFRAVDRFCVESFAKLFDRARAEGRIAPVLDSMMLAQVMATIGDGIFWRRAVDPDHDAGPMIATFLDIVANLLNPTQPLSLRTKAPNHSKAPV